MRGSRVGETVYSAILKEFEETYITKEALAYCDKSAVRLSFFAAIEIFLTNF